MPADMSWLFHSRGTQETSGGDCRAPWRLSKEEMGQERRQSSTTAGGLCAGLAQRSVRPLFVDFEALARQNSLFGGLTPVPENAALLSFVGMGINDVRRYEDAAAAFDQLRVMAPPRAGALIQVFTQRMREECTGSDFLYLHFAGDPLTFGFLVCALTSGGLMAGWQHS